MTTCSLCDSDSPYCIAFTEAGRVTDSYCGACWIVLRRVFNGIDSLVRFVGLAEDAS